MDSDCITINLEDVPDLDIFVVGRNTRIEMARLKYLYTKHLAYLEEVGRNGDAGDFNREIVYEIRIYPRQLLLEWAEYNPVFDDGVDNLGRAKYTEEELRQVLERVFVQRIPYKKHC
nr:hypothetical protein Cduv_433 [Cedratvirus duvanny]